MERTKWQASNLCRRLWHNNQHGLLVFTVAGN